MPLRIYLADLTHIAQGIATEAFPLNIGLISSYAQIKFGKDIEVQLFKYPEELLEAIQKTPPGILACSNYTWNSNLSRYFLALAKSANRNTITVMGGTNYPFADVEQEAFLRKRPEIDIHIYYEGEQAFSNIVERVLSVPALSKKAVLNKAIAGCQFISPENGSLVSGEKLPRILNLDSIPSPYTSGILDKFFDGLLTPLVETTRGCPFACNFCNAGDDYFNRVNFFSLDYVRDELNYIAKKIKKLNVGHVTFADNNFGMIPRDQHIAEIVFGLQQQHDWPKTMTVWTGKNSKERVIDATRLLGRSLNISMAVQSMDQLVQKNIKRDNISMNDYRAIAENLADEGRPQFADLIMLLPGETLESQLKGFDELLDTRIDRMLAYNLAMLHGTPYKDDKNYIEKYGYKTKFRLVVRNFSVIEGQAIFDVEEVAIASKDFSFADFVKARKYLLIIDLCFNSGLFKPLQRYLLQRQCKISTWIRSLYNEHEQFSPEISAIFKSFELDTAQELWDSEEELVTHYSNAENYQNLLDGNCGRNVLYSHRVIMLLDHLKPWVDLVFERTLHLFEQIEGDLEDSTIEELSSLQKYIIATATDCKSVYEVEKTFTVDIAHDILKWIKSENNDLLEGYAFLDPLPIRFYFNEREKQMLVEDFNRFGSSIGGIIKSLQMRGGELPLRSATYDLIKSA
jgi:radical SAM superfamily enzyme YgiQ (UPF0313 family)